MDTADGIWRMNPLPNAVLWRPDQYTGQTIVNIAATQLDGKVSGPAEGRRVLAEWIRFLSNSATNITQLRFVSRVPQELLDAVSRQPTVTSIDVKWGPYKDLSPLASLPGLERISLGGATGVLSLAPLSALPNLSHLLVSQAHRLDDMTQVTDIRSLRTLGFGSISLGSDRSVIIPHLRWVRALPALTALSLPGTRILDPDLTPLLDLPHLRTLEIPLRRQYRKQVFQLAAAGHPLFAAVAARYQDFEAWLQRSST